jgi:ADP-L-glycero-D-manno-heptose 6-epimerase
MGLEHLTKVNRDHLFHWLSDNWIQVQMVVHLGARTDTTEQDPEVFNRLNLGYTQRLWLACTEYGLPLLYASSAATYGLGELGYDDRHELVPHLRPLNPYGVSKNDFDQWALSQADKPYFWAGFKFFNVYGPNEGHKGRMASVVYHAYGQMKESGVVKLFRSHRTGVGHGEQKRDFIYVKDVVKVICHFMEDRNPLHNGLYNLGTGHAQTFKELAHALFDSAGLPAQIAYIDTPQDIRETYQYYTQANMAKLRAAGYTEPFLNIQEGVFDYYNQHLLTGKGF